METLSLFILSIFIRNVPLDSLKYIEDVLREFSNKGYPFSWAKIEKLFPSHAVISIHSGEKVFIHEIEFSKHIYTSNKILKRMIGFSPTWYRDTTVERYIKELKKTGIHIDSFSIVKQGKRYFIRFYGSEDRRNEIEGVISYKEQLQGMLDVQLENFLGYRERFGLEWISYGKDYKKYEVNGRTGWFFGLPLGVYGSGMFLSQDTISMMFEDRVGLFYHIKKEIEIFWGSGMRILKDEEGYNKRRFAEAGLRFKNTEFGLNYGEDFYLGWAKTEFKKGFFEIKNGLYKIKAKKVTSLERLRAGGASTIRGYYEGEFVSSSFIFWQQNYLKLKNFIFLFFDIGLIGSKKFVYSYGPGVYLDYGFLFLELSLGIPENKIEDTKLHVKFLNKFL